MEFTSFYCVPKMQQNLEAIFFSWDSGKWHTLLEGILKLVGTLRELVQFLILQIKIFVHLSIIHSMVEHARKMCGARTKMSKHALHGVQSG